MHSHAVKLTHHWHQVLGVNCNATIEEIKVAYKKQALAWHPDRHIDNARLATEKFVEINNAFKALTRPGLLRTGSQEIFARNTGLSPKQSSPFPRPSPSRRSSRSSLSQSFSSEDFDSEASEEENSSPPSSVCSSSDDSSILHKAPYGFLSTTPTHPCAGPSQSSRTTPISTMKNTSSTNLNPHTHLPAYGPPLSTVGIGNSKEWKYSLKLSLEDLYYGRHLRFRITRYSLSGVRKNVILDIDIPPGCQPGSRIYCRGVGHERRDGSFQDIVFIVEQETHSKFSRIANDLVMDIQIPWQEELNRQGGKLTFTEINGQELSVPLAFLSSKAFKGTCVVPGHGMPVRQGKAVVGRGNLTIRWEILRPNTRWDAFRTLMHLKK